MGAIFSQRIHISNYYVVDFKYIKILFVIYTLIKQKKILKNLNKTTIDVKYLEPFGAQKH